MRISLTVLRDRSKYGTFFQIILINHSFGSQVNDIELSNATHEEAINALKNTGQNLQLTILRDLTQYPDDGK